MNWDSETLKARGLICTGFHLPYNADLMMRAKELRKNMTEAEKKLWFDYFKCYKYRVLRQRPIDNFIVDFYCPKLRLVIEIDGDRHFSENGFLYDEDRTKILAGYGLRVIRFSNSEVLNHFREVCRRIEEIPPLLSPPSCEDRQTLFARIGS